MTGYKTPAQRLEAAHTRIDKLTDEVATLSRVPSRSEPGHRVDSTGVANVVRRATEDSHPRGDRRLEVARHRLDLSD